MYALVYSSDKGTQLFNDIKNPFHNPHIPESGVCFFWMIFIERNINFTECHWRDARLTNFYFNGRFI
ncbi:hypothetical protein METBIDRAFT_31690 [Metschnikowia bicuspidata var. bicuspidata NRRL YB-4993]|uniref:Uncharacterized protein n=1 Tax=Metschnikowia bicuspidata var. bicuspidata NRRL YB-4993 TaxID=869754 RepID=A0A1A0HB20_9ASCO|nr:hypothetical protein METBIDRAFT_31690 [Metschnikowia bicuspidata var. bicuspidata NRRL YB-4993]OBA21077.1 hypothetical protein METBIDRAFT_31690 [Metschnikowia bicuspidata var. bicuspidata NRRL YB-4993]